MSNIKLTFSFTMAFFAIIISCKEPSKRLESEENLNHFYSRSEKIISQDSALLLLKEGNKRFVLDSVLPDY